MEVILLEDVKSVGKKGDVVKLSEGYARNFILKKKLGAKEIAEAAKKQLNLELDKKKLVLKDSIKSIGTHSVKVKLHPQVTAELTVKVSEE